MRCAAAYLVVIAMMQTQSANATIPVAPDMTVHVTSADLEAQHDQLRAAPVHVQALILDEPGELFPGFGRCTVDASVIRIFKGASTLRAGSLFRLAIPCSSALNGRVWRDRDPKHEGSVFRGELTRGRIIEAYLDHFGPRRGYRLAGFPTERSTAPEERYTFLSAASLESRLPVPPPGKPSGKLHFWVSGDLFGQALKRVHQGLLLAGPAPDYPALTLDPSSFDDRGQEQPPAFPTRYVAQTVTHPDHTGRQYRIIYDPDTWRTRVDELGAAGSPTSHVQYGDAFAGMMFDADTRAHTVSTVAHLGGQRGGTWLGAALLGMSPVDRSFQLRSEGSQTVANVRCTAYQMLQERWKPHAFLDEGHLCISDAGLVLETDGVSFFGTLPYVTVKVEYLDHVDASEFNLPRGWLLLKN
jgi:hypothetical protein